MRERFVKLGCTFTGICWLAAFFLSLGYMMSDCIEGAGHSCPSDHARDMGVLKVVFTTAMVNISFLLVLGFRHTTNRKD